MAQLITLETAKLFMEHKQLVDVTDIEDDNLMYEHYYCPDGGYDDDELLDHDYGTATRIERQGWRTYPAFSQTDLQSYLRKLRIIVEAYYSHGYEDPKFSFRVNIISGDTRHMIEQDLEMDQTYEEALELGLREGIKLMKR